MLHVTLGAAAAMAGPVAHPTASWWLTNLPSNAVPTPLERPPADADVVVVGAGMTGCAVAYWLHELYGQRCVLLDARGCAGGATGRNGGHLWPNPARSFEAETTRELLEFIGREGVECDITQQGAAALERRCAEQGVAYADDPANDPESVLTADDEDWGASVAWDESDCAAKLQTDAFLEATEYAGAAQFYPAKVAAAMLRKSQADLCIVRVDAIQACADGGQRVSWSSAATGAAAGAEPASGVVHATQVVVATNGWAPELLPELAPYLHGTRNQVIMTRPLPAAREWAVGGLSVDSDVGARELYAIRRPDGRICLGGARALEEGAAVGCTDDGSLSETVGAYLRRFLAQSFPNLGEVGAVEAEWTGVLGFTRDGRPLVGAVPGRPGLFVGAGFCGHGMPQCFGVGKALALMLRGGAEGAQAVHPTVKAEMEPARFLAGGGGSG